MNTLRLESADVALSLDLPPATLVEARDRRDALAALLRREHAAAADFLLALADFDRRRGWERLGHSSLFAFLTRELGLSKGAAYLRLTAARLLPRFPAVEAALRQGRLCLSAVGELSRVLTPENEGAVLPRFFGCSSREAREVAAAILPCPDPPRRTLTTAVRTAARAAALPAPAVEEFPAGDEPPLCTAGDSTGAGDESPARTPGGPTAVRAQEPPLTHPARASLSRAEVEPLTAELRRLHLTVSKPLLAKLDAARDGFSHAMPGATDEQVLEAALDALLEKQARSKALVKHPRQPRPAEVAPASPASGAESHAREAPPRRRAIPAHVEREVRLRDGNRCQFPLDSGGICGATRQVELDHIVPVALGGASTVENLRCACAFHNRYAAELALGPAAAGVRRRSRR